MDTNLFNTIKPWVEYPLESELKSERSLWVREGKRSIRRINRKDYKYFRQNGRLQDIFGVMRNQLGHLPEAKNIQSENIKALISLKEQVSKSYLKYHQRHNTFILGFFYRLLFARSLNSHYNSIISSIDTCLKKHLSKIPLDDFKKFITVPFLSSINLNELSTEQLSWVIDEKLSCFDFLDESECKTLYEFAPKMSENQLKSLLKKGSLNNFKIDSLQESQRQLIIEYTIEQLNLNKGFCQDNFKILLSLIELMTENQFKIFIASADLQQVRSYLNSIESIELERICHLLSDNLISDLSASKCEKLKLDKLNPKQICLIKEKLSESQLNSLDLSKWPSDAIFDLYESSKLSHAKCTETILFNKWSFQDVEKFIRQGLKSFAKNIISSTWSKDLRNHVLDVQDLSSWVLAHLLLSPFVKLPNELLTHIINFDPTISLVLTSVSKGCVCSRQIDFWGHLYLKNLNSKFNHKNSYLFPQSLNKSLLLRIQEMSQNIFKHLHLLKDKLFDELQLKNFNSKTFKIFTAMQAAEGIQLIEDVNLVLCAPRIFQALSLNWEEFETKIVNENRTKSPTELYSLKAKTIREKIGELGPEALNSVTYLNLNNLGLTSIPKEYFLFKNLTTLSLRNNQLLSLPSEIGNFINLKSLVLSYNQLMSLPQEIGNLINLKNLALSKNPLTSLPPEIGNLINLKDLLVSEHQLTNLPPEIRNFINNLKRLIVKDKGAGVLEFLIP